jgi:regulator of nucleoside diphosphate kinase
MAAVLAPERTLTQLDYVRLKRLLEQLPVARHPGTLDELMATSDLVTSPAVAPDVVTMASRILVADEATGAQRLVSLSYPTEADPAAGSISVLAPLGTALLGLRVGDVARWAGPGGEPHAVRILQMLFQPESTGDYTR